MKYFGRRRGLAAKVVTGILVTSLFGASFYVPERFAVHAEEFEDEEGLTEEEKGLLRLKRLKEEEERLRKQKEEEGEEDADDDSSDEESGDSAANDDESGDEDSGEMAADDEETVTSGEEDGSADEDEPTTNGSDNEKKEDDTAGSEGKESSSDEGEEDDDEDDAGEDEEASEDEDEELRDEDTSDEDEESEDEEDALKNKDEANDKLQAQKEKMLIRGMLMKAGKKGGSSTFINESASFTVSSNATSGSYEDVNTFTVIILDDVNTAETNSTETLSPSMIKVSFSDADAYKHFDYTTGIDSNYPKVVITPKLGEGELLTKDLDFEVEVSVEWSTKTENYNSKGKISAKADNGDPEVNNANQPKFSGTFLFSSTQTWAHKDNSSEHILRCCIDTSKPNLYLLEINETGSIQSGIKSVSLDLSNYTTNVNDTLSVTTKVVDGGTEYYAVDINSLVGQTITGIHVVDNANRAFDYKFAHNAFSYPLASLLQIHIEDGRLNLPDDEQLFSYKIIGNNRSDSYDQQKSGEVKWFSAQLHGSALTINVDNQKNKLESNAKQQAVSNLGAIKRVSPLSTSYTDTYNPVGNGWNKDDATWPDCTVWDATYSVPIDIDIEGEHTYNLSYEYSDFCGTIPMTDVIRFNVDNHDPVIGISHGHIEGDTEEPVYTKVSVSISVSFDDLKLRLFDENNDPVTRVEIFKVEDGNPVYYKTVSCANNPDAEIIWNDAGDGKAILSFKIEEEGEFFVEAYAEDYAGNSSTKTGKHFIIDTTDPEIELEFDVENPVAMNFFNRARTATIRVTDRNINLDDVEIDIETEDIDGNQNTLIPARSDWKSLGQDRYECTVSFIQDGKYSLSVSAVDRAGNVGEPKVEGQFIIDTTGPEITIYFDNNNAKNGIYYNDMRNATVSIKDFGFDYSSLAVTTVAGEGISETPYMDGFRGDGNIQSATIPFREEGKYGFSIRCKDYAGNASDVYSVATFVIDMTVPEIHFDRVENFSANKGDVAPVIHYQDINISEESCIVSISGANRGAVEMAYAEKVIANGKSFTFDNVPRKKKFDDLYTMTAQVTDLAGNIREETLIFSVNRFGSVYVISEDTRAMMAQDYVRDPKAVSITEINVDTLTKKDVTVSRDGDAERLSAGKDYTVRAQGSDETWKSFTYTVPSGYFANDGHYAVTVASVDRATNAQDNRSRDAAIDFTVDRTAPSIVVSDLADGTKYEEDAHAFMVNVTDNMALRDLRVYFDDEPEVVFDSVQLRRTNGTQEIVIPASGKAVDVRIESSDEAGNVTSISYNNIEVAAVTLPKTNDDTKTIEDGEAPLAAQAEQSSAPWMLIVLILLMIAGTGYVYYAKKKQQKAN